jgi:hypothetical protein
MGYANINSGGVGYGPNLTSIGTFLGDAFGIAWSGSNWIIGHGFSSTSVGTCCGSLLAAGINNISLGQFIATGGRNYSNVNGRVCVDRIGGIQFMSFPNTTTGVGIACSLWSNQWDYYNSARETSPPGGSYISSVGMQGVKFFVHTGNSMLTAGADNAIHFTTGLHGTVNWYDRQFPVILIPK